MRPARSEPLSGVLNTSRRPPSRRRSPPRSRYRLMYRSSLARGLPKCRPVMSPPDRGGADNSRWRRYRFRRLQHREERAPMPGAIPRGRIGDFRCLPGRIDEQPLTPPVATDASWVTDASPSASKARASGRCRNRQAQVCRDRLLCRGRTRLPRGAAIGINIAPLTQARHLNDLPALLIVNVHSRRGAGAAETVPGILRSAGVRTVVRNSERASDLPGLIRRRKRRSPKRDHRRG